MSAPCSSLLMDVVKIVDEGEEGTPAGVWPASVPVEGVSNIACASVTVRIVIDLLIVRSRALSEPSGKGCPKRDEQSSLEIRLR